MFITLEGIEGAGKTTQVAGMVEFLTEKGHDCLITREPGGTEIGKRIRSILLDPKNIDLDPFAELLLYNADRAQHIKTLIEPALKAGKTVICDRYFDATVVYQGYARGLDIEKIYRLHKLICNNLMPDITFLLDLPVKTGIKRAWQQIDNGARTKLETRFEEEELNFHEKVRAGYLALAKKESKRFIIIDATLDKAKVAEKILKRLANHRFLDN